jgi:arylsulfatase A-like enzyme
MPRRLHLSLPRVVSLVTLSITLSILQTACDAPAAVRVRARFPRIVLVSIDTLNLLYTNPYNPDADLTPHLEELASEGTLFELAHTQVPQTLPSHTAILTGRSPLHTGVMINGDRVPEEIPTWAELLRDRGWDTAGFISLGVLNRRFGIDRGFDTYDDRIHAVVNRWYLYADEVVERAMPWVETHRDGPFFLWVHLSDPHAPYQPRDSPPDTELLLDGESLGSWTVADLTDHSISFDLPPGRHRLTWRSLRPRRPGDHHRTAIRVRIENPDDLSPWAVAPPTPLNEGIILKYPWEVDLLNSGGTSTRLELQFTGRLFNQSVDEAVEKYSREVRYTDRYLGELRRRFRELGLDEGTLWVVVSDHGEGLKRPGGHARMAFEVQLRTMWLMAGPGIPAGRRIAGTPVLMEDVMPTVFDYLGLPVPEDLDGVSQRGCWTGDRCAPRSEWWAYGVDVDQEAVTAVAGYRWPFKASWHWKKRWGRRLYDLAADPWEWSNLVDRDDLPRPAAALLRRLDRQRGLLQRRLDGRRDGPPDADDREMLKALGYL